MAEIFASYMLGICGSWNGNVHEATITLGIYGGRGACVHPIVHLGSQSTMNSPLTIDKASETIHLDDVAPTEGFVPNPELEKR